MNISQDFIQSIILLLLTALITGFLIPYIFKIIDQDKIQKQKEEDARKQREQKSFEAQLARQTKIIDSQVAFLEKFSESIWKFQLSAIEVMYFHQFPAAEKHYQNVLEKYQQNSGSMLGEIRALISKSIRLVPQETYQQLLKLYYEEFLELDKNLELLAMSNNGKRSSSGKSWAELNRYAVYELAGKVDTEISQLAESMNLKDDVAMPHND